jgi:hypothetical protein
MFPVAQKQHPSPKKTVNDGGSLETLRLIIQTMLVVVVVVLMLDLPCC